MLNIIFNSYLFLRTPALSYEDYDTSILSDLLKTRFFQSAIFFASESLYTELDRCGFNYQLLDKRVKLSLQKYFNRMCHRPTPFGMFSAFSSVSWGLFKDQQNCILEEDGCVYVNPDFQFSADMARKMEKSGEFANARYFSNNAIYSIKNEKRYLTTRYDHDKRKTDFFINSYDSDRLLNKLINFCKNGKTKTEVINWLNGFIENKEDINDYVNDLISEGLLITELYPNMTGEKYYKRLVKIASENKEHSELANEMLAYNKLVGDMEHGSELNVKTLTQNHLYTLFKNKFKSMFYVAFERKSESSLDNKYQGYIKDGLNCLNRISADVTPKPLINFKNKFKTRFEDQDIPLLQAIDREAGIGYEGLENNLVVSELLEGIQLDLQKNSLNFNWTPVHEYFLSKFLKIRNDECITIGDNDLEKFKEQSGLKIPPSFSVVFRVCGDKIWIEQAGGCTATGLIGRFTLFSEKVFEEARYIADVEEKLNEEVIFAEISCFNDEHAANINSNSGVWAYEIPIGVHSTLDDAHLISLSDLTVSVVGDNIVLRSKKLNKIIIPRLSSAFNYSRSELSVFRFLCDLQFQGLKYNFNFDLRALLPGLGYYPRVEYKNCILYPCTWILSADEIAELADENTSKSNFYSLSEKIRLKRQFALTEGDNQLLFDQYDAESISLFIKVIKGKSTVVLQEVFFDESATVVNGIGKAFTGQFIASVFSDEVTYSQKIPERFAGKKSKVRRIYLPGDEWVYLKLYCHPSSSNGILIKDIGSIISRLKKQNILKSWFFVRYNDPDHHLRIRIQINPDDAAEVVKFFEKKMRDRVEKGSVNNLVLDTYKREIERYGEEIITHAENIFSASSDLILNYLKNMRHAASDFSELHLAIISVDALLETFFPEHAAKIDLLRTIHESMKHEFEDSKQVKLQLDNKYREYSSFINNISINKPAIMAISGKKQFNGYLKALAVLKLNTGDLLPGNRMKLVADLVHMHLNRLFNEKQRNHEFIIYYLLCKHYASAEARKGKELKSFSPASKHLGINHINEAVFK